MHIPLLNAIWEFGGETLINEPGIRVAEAYELFSIIKIGRKIVHILRYVFIKKMKTGIVLSCSLNFVPEINQWCN